MKCDRVFPVCGRCTKTGRATSCAYDPRLLEAQNPDAPELTGESDAAQHSQHIHPTLEPPALPASTTNPPDTVTWKLRMQEKRIEILEKKLSALEGTKHTSRPNPASSLDHEESGRDVTAQPEAMLFRGKSFKTQFYGSTGSCSLLSYFPELYKFTKEAMSTDSSMVRIEADFQRFRGRRKAAKVKARATCYTDADLLALLPEKNTVDELVSVYFENFETTYRILHRPSFWKDYQAFWEDPQKSQPSMVVTILLVLATVRCFSTTEETNFIGDSSSGRERATTWIDACEFWLYRHSRKHLTLEYFQIQCLCVLAKQVNCIKMKQDWVHTGDIMRLAMASGLHRDPSLLKAGKTSEFHKEMRRRVWATIVEMELQASIEKGLPSSVSGLEFDCPVPANIEDEALCPAYSFPASSKPIEQYTAASYLHASRHSLAVRIALTSLLNSGKPAISYEEVLEYDSKISSLLKCLPQWSNSAGAIPSILLDFQLRQFLVILHTPYARLAASDSRYTYSAISCLSAASTLITHHSALVGSGKHMLNMLRNDVFRAATCIAQTVYLTSVPQHGLSGSVARPPDNSSPSNSPNYPPPATATPLVLPTQPHINIDPCIGDNFILSSVRFSAASLVEKALEIFEQKMMRLGTGYMEFWLMSAAYGIMPSVSDPSASAEDMKARGRKAVEKISRVSYKILALQDSSAVGAEPPTVVERIVPQTSAVPEAVMEGEALGMGVMSLDNVSTGMPTPFADLEDMSSWTLTDFWAFDMLGET